MRYLRILLFLLCAQVATAQHVQLKPEVKKRYEEADIHLQNQQYTRAIPMLLALDSVLRDNYNLKYKIGLAYHNSETNRSRALPYLEAASMAINDSYKENNLLEAGAPPSVLMLLAQSYHLNRQFDRSAETIEKFRKYLSPEDEEANREITRLLAWNKNGKKLINEPINILIENLGDSVNSIYPEYAPVISADQTLLIFTSKRPSGEKPKVTEEGGYFEDIYVASRENGRWSAPQPIGASINSEGHEASIGLSADGQTLLIYKDDKGDGNIYISRLQGEEWSQPNRLPSHINTKGWEPSASISADGEFLYFTSDRKGGFGGRDIYRSKKLPNGEWGLPVNLGPAINSPYDEDAPFIHPDGKTLFYSSNGVSSMGGFDVFNSVMNEDGSWSSPENMGYPLNTTDDDIFYVLSADGTKAYYSSFNEKGFGEKDIYVATLVGEKEKPLALVKGAVRAYYGGVPEGVEIIVSDNETGDIVGVYYPNSKTGAYLFILPPGHNYNISYEAAGFLFKSENLDLPDSTNYYEINRSVDLDPLVVGSKIVLNNIFFETGKDKVAATSRVELQKIKKLLDVNPNVTVEISGHTDSRGSEELNQKLSQKRADAVVSELVAMGVNKERLLSKGYGETRPVAKETKADGSDDPAARALNRRVELQIVGKQ